MARADRPIESDSDVLDPVTVPGNEPETDTDEDAEPEATETPPQAAEGARQQATPGARGERGEGAQGRTGPRQSKPSSWKGFIEKAVAKATADSGKTIGELRQQLAQMQGRWEAMQTQQSRGGEQQPSGPAQELQGIAKEMQDIAKLAANPNLTDDQRQDLANRYQSLDDKRLEMRATAVAERIVSERLKDMPQGPSPEESTGRAILASEYPRLMSDPAAAAEAKSYFGYLAARNGGVETPDLFREACQFVYTQRGWAAAPPRTNGRERAMFETALGTGRGGGGNDGAVTFTPQDLKVMRGSGVTPEQVAEQSRLMMKRGY